MKFKVGDKVILTRDNKTIKGVVVFVDQGKWTDLPYLIEVAGLDRINYDNYTVRNWTPTAIWTYEYSLKLDEPMQNVFDEFDFKSVCDAFGTILNHKIDLVDELAHVYHDTNKHVSSIFDIIAIALEDEIDVVGEALERLVELQQEER